MVDVVDLAAAVAQFDQDLDDGDDVVVGQRRSALQFAATHAAVEFHPADGGEVVALLGEEETVEQRFDGVLGRRLARPHHPVDRDARGRLVGRVVGAQRLRDVRALVEIVRVYRLDFGNARIRELLQKFLGHLVIGLGQHFARRLVDDVGRERAADDVFGGHGDPFHAAFGQFAHVARGDPLVALDDHLAVFGQDVEARHLAAQALGYELELRALWRQVERVEDEELPEDVLVGEADRLQERGHRHLAAAVHAEEQEILGVELEVEPRAAVGNHASRKQELAGAVRLAAVVLEEHTGRAVQLRDDDALGAVDDEGAVFRHERNLAHVDLLLLHFLDRFFRRFLVHQDQAHLRPQRRAIREAALLAFGDVERRREQRKSDELEPRVARMARDRENRRERGLQALVLALIGGRVRLQERAIRRELRFEQKRDRQDARTLGEAFPDAFLLGK